MKIAGTIIAVLAVVSFIFVKPVEAQDVDSSKTITEKIANKSVVEEKAITSGNLKVEKFTCGTSVENRELQGENTTFSAAIERIYCFSLITGCDEPTTVEHVWYYGDKEKARVTLDVKYPRVRTWSYKTMMPEWTGEWRIEILDADGKLLDSNVINVE